MNSVTPVRNRGEKKQGAADRVHDARKTAPHDDPDDPARVDGKRRGALIVQGGESASRAHRHHASGSANRGVVDVDLAGGDLQSPIGQPSRIADHHGEQIGHEPEQVQQYVGDPGAHDPALIGDPINVAGVRPAGVAGVIARDRYQQIDGHRGDDEQGSFARTSRQGASQQADKSGFVLYRLGHGFNPVSRYRFQHGHY